MDGAYYQLLKFKDVFGNKEDGWGFDKVTVIGDGIFISGKTKSKELLGLLKAAGVVSSANIGRVTFDLLGDGSIDVQDRETNEPFGQFLKEADNIGDLRELKVNWYLLNEAEKLREISDRILDWRFSSIWKNLNLSQKDKDDFYSIAAETLWKATLKWDGKRDFQTMLWIALCYSFSSELRKRSRNNT